MSKNEVRILRSGLLITYRCTLKCKLCGGYMPEYENPLDEEYEKLCKIIDEYFKVVDFVGDFSLTGGETLMYKELDKIILKTLQYREQYNRLLILTNGTLLFKESTLEILSKNTDKAFVTVSDYGPISAKTEEIVEQLTRYNVRHRIIKYHGEDLFCNGWVDYGDHAQKHFTQEEIDEQGRNCAVRNRHCNFYIAEGQIHSCGRSFRRMELNIIPKNPDEYVDLLDESIPLEKKKETVMKIYNSTSSYSCAFCNGLRKDSKRYKPAEQI